MKTIISYVTERKEENIVLTLGQAEDILAFIDNNKLTDKAKNDFSGWYDVLKSQIDK